MLRLVPIADRERNVGTFHKMTYRLLPRRTLGVDAGIQVVRRQVGEAAYHRDLTRRQLTPSCVEQAECPEGDLLRRTYAATGIGTKIGRTDHEWVVVVDRVRKQVPNAEDIASMQRLATHGLVAGKLDRPDQETAEFQSRKFRPQGDSYNRKVQRLSSSTGQKSETLPQTQGGRQVVDPARKYERFLRHCIETPCRLLLAAFVDRSVLPAANLGNGRSPRKATGTAPTPFDQNLDATCHMQRWDGHRSVTGVSAPQCMLGRSETNDDRKRQFACRRQGPADAVPGRSISRLDRGALPSHEPSMPCRAAGCVSPSRSIRQGSS